MSGANKTEEAIRLRIREIPVRIPGSLADQLCFDLLSWDEERGEAVFSCRTAAWMTNFSGTLHGGMGAAVLDQAMSLVVHALKPAAVCAPAVQLKTDFHRPVSLNAQMQVAVQLVSRTSSLIHLNAQIRQPGEDKLSVSGSGIYFPKRSQE